MNLLLDTFNDNENFSAFVTTPAGNRLDAEITNDAEGANFFNQNWNGFWDVAVAENKNGWFAEMRIPFATLRFQDDDGKVVFGMVAHRLIGPRNERITFPAIPPNWSASQWKASQAQDVLLEGVYSRRPFFLTPYLLGGRSRLNTPQGEPGGFTRKTDTSRELGFDLKTALSSNLNIDLTVNTDFAQVEADDEQVNITRFSLFFPERRQFFQERSGVFSYRLGDVSRLFHSRRIGLTDNEQPLRIYGGLRTVGRIGQWDVGLLNMQTAGHDSLPSENLGVGRIRRRVLNPYSYIGAMATSRLAQAGRYNLAYGADALLRLSKVDYLTLRWAHTFDDSDSETSADFLSRAYSSAEWERRATVGLGSKFEVRRAPRHFRPGLGFNLRPNILLLNGQVSWGWLAGPSSPAFKHLPSLKGLLYLRDDDNSFESATMELRWRTEFKQGAAVEVNAIRDYDDLREPFELASSAFIPEGRHSFDQVGAKYVASEGGSLRGSVAITGGSYYDGNRISGSFSPAWSPSRHLELSGGYELNRIRFPKRSQRLNAHVVRLRLVAAANTHLSASSLMQYNSVEDRVVVNARVRYHFREGNDLHLVFNDRYDTADGPRNGIPRSLNRTMLIKYTYTFIR